MHAFIKKHLFIIIIITFGLILAGFIFKEGINNEQKMTIESDPIPTLKSDDESPEELIDMTIKIDIKGEVNQPGVYEVDDDFRVIDLIRTAGGLTTEADESKINLAEKVVDEMVIIVPKVGEELVEPLVPFNSGKGEHTINVNLATVEELSTLNGIGPKKAQALIDYREDNGPFQQTEDILNVPGIGEKTLESFKDDIRIR